MFAGAKWGLVSHVLCAFVPPSSWVAKLSRSHSISLLHLKLVMWLTVWSTSIDRWAPRLVKRLGNTINYCSATLTLTQSRFCCFRWNTYSQCIVYDWQQKCLHFVSLRISWDTGKIVQQLLPNPTTQVWSLENTWWKEMKTLKVSSHQHVCQDLTTTLIYWRKVMNNCSGNQCILKNVVGYQEGIGW